MAFEFAKIATALALPLGLCSLAAIAGVVLVLLGRPRLGATSSLIALAALWLMSTPAISRSFEHSLERTAQPVAMNHVPSADVILLLAGGVDAAYPPRTDVDLGAASDRPYYAAQLYRRGKAPFILVSGGHLPWNKPESAEASSSATFLRELGVPTDHIVLETSSRNTHENCVESKKIMDARGWKDALLVTSALHMRRALATCRTAGIQTIPAPTDFETPPQPGASVFDWIPDPSCLGQSSRTLKEIAGYAVYRTFGWILPGGKEG